MLARVLTALVLAPAAVAAVLWAPEWLMRVLCAIVALGCFHEFHRLATLHGCGFPPLVGLAGGAALVWAPSEQTLLAATLAVLAGMGILLRQADDLKCVLPGAGALALGMLYCFAPWRFGMALHGVAPHWLLFALALNWIADSFAYLGGRATGRHKLAPRLSPGKTVEGSLWSLAGSILFAWLFLGHFAPERGLGQVLGLSVAANVAGQVGDLAESALKRGAGVKDSGNLLPGHGGWLDRLDSSLFTMPVVWLWISRW